MKEKPTVIAVVNQKGGTAKTTTVENLGIGLAREEKKVLLVDTDPQGSLTISLGYSRPDELETTLFDLLNKTINEDSVSAGEGIVHQAEGIDLIPANISLAGLEVALVNTMNRERILKQFLEPVNGNYDYVLLDCMSSLGMLTVNALAAADWLRLMRLWFRCRPIICQLKDWNSCFRPSTRSSGRSIRS